MSDDRADIQTYTLAEFERLTGRVYVVAGIDGDTSEYVQVVKSDLLETLRRRGEKGVVLGRDDGGWLYLGVAYDGPTGN